MELLKKLKKNFVDKKGIWYVILPNDCETTVIT